MYIMYCLSRLIPRIALWLAVIAMIYVNSPSHTLQPKILLYGPERLLNHRIMFKLCLASLLSLDSCTEMFIWRSEKGDLSTFYKYITKILSIFAVKALF